MALTTVGALLLVGAICVVVVGIRYAPKQQEPSLHPLRDEYAPSDEDEASSDTAM